MKKEGYGYEWEAELVGGPADGCLDIVIQLNQENPPKYIKRILDGEEIARESLGEKLIEYLMNKSIKDDQKVAVYMLKKEINERCLYNYLETTTFKNYKLKYE